MSEIFRSQNGARIEVEQVNPRNWWARFTDSKVWFGKCRTKLDAIFLMSAKLRKSAKSLDWTREE